MTHHIGATLGRYKHVILIGLALVALGSYFLPLNVALAGHNNGNTAASVNKALEAALKGSSGSSSSSHNSNLKTKLFAGHNNGNTAASVNKALNTVTSSTNPSSSSSSQGVHVHQVIKQTNNGNNGCAHANIHAYGCLVHNPHA